MRNCSLAILAVLLTVISVLSTSAQTNQPNALILPPANWDDGKHVLASLIATNKPGDYALPMTWCGTEKVTARIGWYATNRPARTKKEQWFEYDKLTVTPHRIFLDDRFVSNGLEGAAYRASLPSDAEFRQIRDVWAVSNLFGWNPFLKETNYAAGLEVGMHLCTLRAYDSIETVEVEFRKHAPGPEIDGILVRRGHLFPRQKSD